MADDKNGIPDAVVIPEGTWPDSDQIDVIWKRAGHFGFEAMKAEIERALPATSPAIVALRFSLMAIAAGQTEAVTRRALARTLELLAEGDANDSDEAREIVEGLTSIAQQLREKPLAQVKV